MTQRLLAIVKAPTEAMRLGNFGTKFVERYSEITLYPSTTLVMIQGRARILNAIEGLSLR